MRLAEVPRMQQEQLHLYSSMDNRVIINHCTYEHNLGGKKCWMCIILVAWCKFLSGVELVSGSSINL